MKSYIINAVCMLCLLSCNPAEFGDRKESAPVIESATVEPVTFNFGDTVKLTAQLSDPSTKLATLTYQIVSNKRVIGSGSFPLSNSEFQISEKIVVPLIDNQADDNAVSVVFTAINVLKGESTSTVTGLTGKKSAFSKLYLVNNLGNIVTLTPQANNKELYTASGLTISNTFAYRIAEKITSNGQIDYSGKVWSNSNGRLATDLEANEAAFISLPGDVYTQSIEFNYSSFAISFKGSKTIGANQIALNKFTANPYNGEDCRKYTMSLNNNQEYDLMGELASNMLVCNLDFFERTAENKVKFTGQTGTYNLIYNVYRKTLLIDNGNMSYPDYLLMTGNGIGYPTKVQGIDKAHTSWGFNNIMSCIPFKKVDQNVFRGTIFIDKGADFKAFENNGWGNEKRLDMFKSIIGEQILKGDNNWNTTDKLDINAFYQITINLNNQSIDVKKVKL